MLAPAPLCQGREGEEKKEKNLLPQRPRAMQMVWLEPPPEPAVVPDARQGFPLGEASADDSATESAVLEVERALLELAETANRALCVFALNGGSGASTAAVRGWYAHAAHRAVVESLADQVTLWTERLGALLGAAMTLRSPAVGPLPCAMACLLACARAFTRCAALRDGFRWVGHPWVANEVARRPAAFLGALTEGTIATWAPACSVDPFPSPVCAAAAALMNTGLGWPAVRALLALEVSEHTPTADPPAPAASEADVVVAELTAAFLRALLLLARRALRRAPAVPVYEVGGSLYTSKHEPSVPLVVFGHDSALSQVVLTDEQRFGDEVFRHGADELPVPQRDFGVWEAPVESRGTLGVSAVLRLPDPGPERSADAAVLSAGTACGALPREVRIGAQNAALRALVLCAQSPALAVAPVRHGDPPNAAARTVFVARPGALPVSGAASATVAFTERALDQLVLAMAQSEPAAFRPILHEPVAVARRLGGVGATLLTVVPLDLAPIPQQAAE